MGWIHAKGEMGACVCVYTYALTCVLWLEFGGSSGFLEVKRWREEYEEGIRISSTTQTGRSHFILTGGRPTHSQISCKNIIMRRFIHFFTFSCLFCIFFVLLRAFQGAAAAASHFWSFQGVAALLEKRRIYFPSILH